jgi:hypothetical protein
MLSRFSAAHRPLASFTRSASSVKTKDAMDAVADWTSNVKLAMWINEHVAHMKPDRVHLVDGSEAESKEMCDQMVRSGTLIKLDEEKRPNSYLARSDVGDVARVEETTFICSEQERDAGVSLASCESLRIFLPPPRPARFRGEARQRPLALVRKLTSLMLPAVPTLTMSRHSTTLLRRSRITGMSRTRCARRCGDCTRVA